MQLEQLAKLIERIEAIENDDRLADQVGEALAETCKLTRIDAKEPYRYEMNDKFYAKTRRGVARTIIRVIMETPTQI